MTKTRKFSLLILLACSLFVGPLLARQSFEFSFAEKLHILSDKAYRRTVDDVFEAVGNVVITHGTKSLYGEKATLSLSTGEITVIGNVRYVDPALTLYCSKLEFNMISQKMTVHDARVLSDNYVVLGKKLQKIDEKNFVGEDAEYSTCRDCPESWSVFGRKISITVGEYVRIKHAFIKVKGVVSMYVPYIILPIKKERESGLLFPKLAFGFEHGTKFQQPWFWAIGPSTDMTLTPSVWGKRGFGNELEFRHAFGEKKWSQLDVMQVWDRIYDPNAQDDHITNHHPFRFFSNYEHHFNISNEWNHHFSYIKAHDLDLMHDFSSYTDSHMTGGEYGGGGFLSYQGSRFGIGLEGYHKQNALYPDPESFDNDYVQVLPKTTFSLSPFALFHSNYFPIRRFDIGFDGDFTIFKQNHVMDSSYIRNSRRTVLNPYWNWTLGSVGPVMLSNKGVYEYQDYYFPYEEYRDFRKRGFVFESEASVEFEKIFGKASRDLELRERTNSHDRYYKEPSLIGSIPKFEKEVGDHYEQRVEHSYKHVQKFALKHYYLVDQKYEGNRSFARQLDEDEGIFDYRDAIKSKSHELDHVSFRTEIPKDDTIEIQWNNSLIQKTPKFLDGKGDKATFLYDRYSYGRTAHFDVSQGYNLGINTDSFKDKLTRLKVNTGLSINSTSVSFTEYYFYSSQKHIFTLNGTQSFSLGHLSFGFKYDSASEPIDKAFQVSGEITPVDLIKLYGAYDFDIDESKQNRMLYGMVYSPRNNCWKIDLSYESTIVESKIAFNFLVNFNDNNFKSISGQE